MEYISLCAKWTLGRVKDRYIKYDKAGDYFVGRAVTGLLILKKEFTISPPYFDILSYQKYCDKEIKEPKLKIG